MRITFAPAIAIAVLALASVPAQVFAGFSYCDDFESGSASNWTILGSNTDGTNDFVSEFGFDVSTLGIPNSPNGDNIALRLAAGIAAPDGREAVSAFLTGVPVTIENYILTVDIYDAFAPPPGGTGTTRNAGVGIEHADPPLGPVHTRAGSTPAPYSATDGGNGQDGLVFAYNTDDDDGISAFWLLDADDGDPLADLTDVGTWADPGNTTPGGHYQANSFYQGIIPANPDDGAPSLEFMGNQWATVTITKDGSDVSVEIFGTEIVTETFAGIGPSLISLTNERPFDSTTPAPGSSECYFDALCIDEILTPPTTAVGDHTLYR